LTTLCFFFFFLRHLLLRDLHSFPTRRSSDLRRADTKEGKLQVELAQLQYMLPRLHGMGTILSRLGGGIGTRGPGETKLETDQRHIRRRIDDIKARLKDVVKQRDQYRERR